MISIEEIPVERIHEFWEIHLKYLVDDGIISDDEDIAYFSGEEYRGILENHMIRSKDKHHMVYFCRDGVRIGAASYCTYQSEGGKSFIMDFWVFPEFRGSGTGHQCYEALEQYTKSDGAKYYELNSEKENSVRFWKSIGFVENGKDEYDMLLLIKREYMDTVSLQPIDRMLLHEYYKHFVMDADIFMDMSSFREYVYIPEKVDAYYDRLLSQNDRVDFLIMADGKPVGEIALKHIDEKERQCELSIHLQNDAVKNKGYGTQAERLILEYAFQLLGMTTVIANSVLKNKRSRHTLEKVGFRETGRDETFVYYRLSLAEWLAREKADQKGNEVEDGSS